VTHDELAGLLGTRRASVTLALQVLHERGAVGVGRGWVEIRDGAALHDATCACYRTIREAYREALQ
jgi:hypothetical protein